MSFLKDAGVLSPFRRAVPRRTVWEIGGGWGGLAYHFKTICPEVTYLITGQADMLLLSAAYLMTLFPSANVRFYEPETPRAFWEDWHAVDFAFAPEHVVGAIPDNRVDLTVDVAMLDRMTPARAARHVARAHETGSPYFLSLCAHTETGGNAEAPVPGTIERFYWRHPMCAPRYLGRRFATKAGTRYETPASLRAGVATPSRMNHGPRVVLGLPAYNRPDSLPQAIESLLSQTFGAFELVIVDDANSPETALVAERYRRHDPRIHYEANPLRLGMVDNWRRVFERGRRVYPGATYFAWVSDHDVWHPRWLRNWSRSST